jgi:vacuolar protein sorting-associated protein 54
MVQTKAFLDHLHETFKNRLINTLDNERWVQCDVASERQAGLDRLASGKAFLQTNGNSTSSTTPSSSSSIVSSDPDGASTVSSGDTKKKDFRSALVEGHQFKVVWSVMLLIEIALSYLEVSSNFPLVTTDIISKIVELFKLFDVRTKQLVLGAQAIQSAARLKNISAKHLCITAQSVGLLLALLPHVRAALLAQLPPKHHMLLTELDRISHNLIDHHNQLLSKFVGIVGDFVDASAQRYLLFVYFTYV